ncbi:MAG TPA: hypothetical protein VMU45_07185 [Candidatus Eisenbacteria bacterium]|nr:hypothetical protein [Candidatus Eisenbacteria bacterium]
MQSNKGFVVSRVLAFVVVMLCSLWNAPTLQAFNPQPDPPACSMIGMTQDQMARFGVACSAATIHELPPDPCRGTLTFADRYGDTLKETRYDLQPGQGAFLDLNPDEVKWGNGIRIELQPVIAPLSGRSLPAVQLLNLKTAKTETFAGPISFRTSLIDNAH